MVVTWRKRSMLSACDESMANDADTWYFSARAFAGTSFPEAIAPLTMLSAECDARFGVVWVITAYQQSATRRKRASIWCVSSRLRS